MLILLGFLTRGKKTSENEGISVVPRFSVENNGYNNSDRTIDVYIDRRTKHKTLCAPPIPPLPPFMVSAAKI